MSVTVADLLMLPSLRRAEVLGGHKGLTKIVSSISVLESTDPDFLIDGLFPSDEFFGSEIVITGFLNTQEDVDCQCSNMRRLSEGGEVGIILFYVGVYLPDVDPRLVELADEMDFVLICMPRGERLLRYSEVISDVTECIYRDRMHSESLVAEILGQVSRLPSHQRSINTVLKMLSDRFSASVVLASPKHQILNLIAWPRSIENIIKDGIARMQEFPADGVQEKCTFLPDSHLYRFLLNSDIEQEMELYLIKGGLPIRSDLLEQAVDIMRISINIWGSSHGEVAVHELARAILQDEPMKMRRLAEIFHIDVTSIHDMWILHGDNVHFTKILTKKLPEIRDILSTCAGTAFMDIYEGSFLLFLNGEATARDKEELPEELIGILGTEDPEATIVTCGGLQNTGDVRRAFLCHQEYLRDTRKIFPGKRIFGYGELEFTRECRLLTDQGETALNACMSVLLPLKSEKEEVDLRKTLAAYLLDGNSSVTKTAKLLYLHQNTIKYRLQRISELLGYRPNKMPETMKLYQAVAVSRLIS